MHRLAHEKPSLVAHKHEGEKEMRSSADILTLTATPIPRTLHMAMVGLRDISILASPPTNRSPVKTYVSKFELELVREAILREIKRGGQVFLVHNRVENIEAFTRLIQNLIPECKIRFGHGQMPENILEGILIDFIEQKFHVFVCTTIIESGVDLPNVNTLIVDHAERFGLAQMYQLRGRVGRSATQAYAYFMTGHSVISQDASHRLDVLAANQELGAGFQIANYDLELRGAGTLLGAEQSGYIADVGLELYSKMLEEAINDLKGEEASPLLDAEIKLHMSGIIPNAYISSENRRLSYYKRIFSCAEDDELFAIGEEFSDRFGEPPTEVKKLLEIARLKIRLHRLSVSKLLELDSHLFELTFAKLSENQISQLISATNQHPDVFRLKEDFSLQLRIPRQGKMSDRKILRTVITKLEILLELLKS